VHVFSRNVFGRTSDACSVFTLSAWNHRSTICSR
jgi:hypothetical protein